MSDTNLTSKSVLTGITFAILGISVAPSQAGHNHAFQRVDQLAHDDSLLASHDIMPVLL